MPTTTPNLGLAQPVGGDAPSQLRIAISGNASLLDGYSLLTSTVTNAANATITRGQSVIASPSTTQTLPAASANAMVAVTAASTVTGATPVTVSGTHIYGVGLSNAVNITLGTPGAYVVLQSDGTNWYVIGGQVNSGWTSLTLVNGWTTAPGSYPLSYRQVGDRIELKGTVTGGTATPIAAVPAGMLPTNQVQMPNGATLASAVGSRITAPQTNSTIGFDGTGWSLS